MPVTKDQLTAQSRGKGGTRVKVIAGPRQSSAVVVVVDLMNR